MRKIGRKNVRKFSEKGWPTRSGFRFNMNTYLICDPGFTLHGDRRAGQRCLASLQKPAEIADLM